MPSSAVAQLRAYESLLAELGKSLINASDPDTMRRRVAACLADAVNVGVLDVDWPGWEPQYPGPFDYCWCRDVLDELTEPKRDLLWYATGALIDVVRATGHESTIAARDVAGQRMRDYFRARGNDAALAAWTPQSAVNVDTAPDTADPLDDLRRCHRMAYLAFVYAETQAERTLTDRDAWEWLDDHGADAVAGMGDYELPTLDTWARYLREARRVLDARKNTPRAGRATGRSIVRER